MIQGSKTTINIIKNLTEVGGMHIPCCSAKQGQCLRATIASYCTWHSPFKNKFNIEWTNGSRIRY